VTRLLAIESSTLTTSVAVLENDAVRAERESGVDTHSERLIEMIDQSLAEAGFALAAVDAVAIGLGPGSFTGLRIAMATAKGLCFATGKPLWGVSSLAALALDTAAAAPRPCSVLAVMDARRGELFVGAYRIESDDRVIALAPDRVIEPEQLASLASELGLSAPLVGGDGASLYSEIAARAGRVAAEVRLTPSAASVGKIAQSSERIDVSAGTAPVYIRPSEAEVKFPDGNPSAVFRRPR
jgi:tRNA threonylcarbamoyladenosine biosynthesis protein TsaB